MFWRARRETGHRGVRTGPDRRRASSSAVVGVEPLEGRTLLSYFVVVKNHKVIAIHGGDARVAQPFHSNGLAFTHDSRFYRFYTGPRTPNLLGVSATGVVSGNRVTDGILTLTGTVAGPIIARPTTTSQQAIYTFGIDRGGSAHVGPFPGLGHVRFDAAVVVPLTRGGLSTANPPYMQFNNAWNSAPPGSTSASGPLTMSTINLSPSSVTIRGNTLSISVPLTTSISLTIGGTTNSLTTGTSSGSALNQWNANFITRFPSPYGSHMNGYHSLASFTPRTTMFQLDVQHVTPIRSS